MGECVIEIQRNDIENHTTKVRLVGINIHNRQTDKFIGCDRYHPTFKKAVSYTHLDVYKRQGLRCPRIHDSVGDCSSLQNFPMQKSVPPGSNNYPT